MKSDSQKESEIISRLRKINESSARVSELLVDLHAKLDFVLIPTPTEDASKKDKEIDNGSPMLNALRGIHYAIIKHGDRIELMLSQIEL